ncbi:hypothetical protein LOC67_07575 [Stieleria sp. JC731]|uniref:hypothetical protein n=1 Tax=Pirellulaceae TaxID=2691357 RepID=UPI001E5439ED|nr:hypothetical protein [Stieleria sp. JC731]MCC9600416.1 hypothetical protein [Stieleria sp. JC731]
MHHTLAFALASLLVAASHLSSAFADGSTPDPAAPAAATATPDSKPDQSLAESILNSIPDQQERQRRELQLQIIELDRQLQETIAESTSQTTQADRQRDFSQTLYEEASREHSRHQTIATELKKSLATIATDLKTQKTLLVDSDKRTKQAADDEKAAKELLDRDGSAANKAAWRLQVRVAEQLSKETKEIERRIAAFEGIVKKLNHELAQAHAAEATALKTLQAARKTLLNDQNYARKVSEDAEHNRTSKTASIKHTKDSINILLEALKKTKLLKAVEKVAANDSEHICDQKCTSANCPNCLRKELLLEIANVPATIDDHQTADHGALFQRLITAMTRSETLQKQISELQEYNKSLHLENTSIRTDLREKTLEVISSVSERMHLATQIKDEDRDQKDNEAEWKQLQECDSTAKHLLDELRSEESQTFREIEQMHKLNSNLMAGVRDAIGHQLQALYSTLNKCLPHSLDVERSHEGLQSEAMNVQGGANVPPNAERKFSVTFPSDFEPGLYYPDVELLLRSSEWTEVKKASNLLNFSSRYLNRHLLRCDELTHGFLGDVTHQQKILLLEVLGLALTTEELNKLTSETDIINQLVLGDERLLSATPEDDLGRRLPLLERLRLEYAQREQEKQFSGNRISDARLLKQLGDTAIQSCHSLRELYLEVALCSIELKRHHQALHQLSHEFNSVVNEIKDHRIMLELKLAKSQTLNERLESLITKAKALTNLPGAKRYQQLIWLKEELEQSKAIREVNDQLATLRSENAVEEAESARTQAKLYWKRMKANKAAEHAYLKHAPDTKTSFDNPCHFPIPRYARDGNPDFREGLLIAGGMQLTTRADGTFKLDAKVNRQSFPVTLHLEICFETIDNSIISIPLEPQKLLANSDRYEFVEYEADGTPKPDNWIELHYTGSHPALKRCGGGILWAQRKGSATFGHGFEGLDVYRSMKKR